VILNAAMSLDGKISTKNGRARISSPEDMERVQRLRASVNGIMVGINTLLTDDPSLRMKIETDGPPPARIVVDSRLRTPPGARLFSFPGKIIIGTTVGAPVARRKRLMDRAEIIAVGDGQVDLVTLLEELRDRDIRRVLLEGGGTLNWGMLESGLIDEIVVAVAPLVIGGRETITLFEGDGIEDMSQAYRLRPTGVERYGPDLVLTFKPRGAGR